MRKITKKEIEKRALIELVIYLEKQIEKITRQSEIELEKQNKLRKNQGIHQKARIDPNSLKKAINLINLKGHCQSPKKVKNMISIRQKNRNIRRSKSYEFRPHNK